MSKHHHQAPAQDGTVEVVRKQDLESYLDGLRRSFAAWTRWQLQLSTRLWSWARTTKCTASRRRARDQLATVTDAPDGYLDVVSSRSLGRCNRACPSYCAFTSGSERMWTA